MTPSQKFNKKVYGVITVRDLNNSRSQVSSEESIVNKYEVYDEDESVYYCNTWSNQGGRPVMIDKASVRTFKFCGKDGV
ncbi:MAG: hypothetical protein GY909_15595 [Oligoflexia bacterium]|nr:hypothetical protein [Oligoflexia bacterium]